MTGQARSTTCILPPFFSSPSFGSCCSDTEAQVSWAWLSKTCGVRRRAGMADADARRGAADEGARDAVQCGGDVHQPHRRRHTGASSTVPFLLMVLHRQSASVNGPSCPITRSSAVWGPSTLSQHMLSSAIDSGCCIRTLARPWVRAGEGSRRCACC